MATSNWIKFTRNEGKIDFSSVTARMVLVRATYTPDQDNDETWADVSTHENAASGGYTQNGQAVTFSGTPGTNLITWDIGNVTWTSNPTFTTKYPMLVADADDNGTLASTDLIIAYADLDTSSGSAEITANGTSDFIIKTEGANGVFRSTLSTS